MRPGTAANAIDEFSLRLLAFERVKQPIGKRFEKAGRHSESASVETNRSQLAPLRLNRTNFGDRHVALAQDDSLAFLHPTQIFGKVTFGLSYVDSNHVLNSVTH